jgi:hypothetical protein
VRLDKNSRRALRELELFTDPWHCEHVASAHLQSNVGYATLN